MKTNCFYVLIVFLLYALSGFSQSEPFNQTILNTKPSGTVNDYNLAHPFEILYGRDNYLYISEKIGRILQVDTGSGLRKIVLDHQSNTYLTITRDASGNATSIGQDGMMGMALHPDFGKNLGKDSIFIAYTSSAGSVRISRFQFNTTNAGTGLIAEYFNNKTLTGLPVLRRTDATVNFNWGTGSPDPLVTTDNFSARWVGQVLAPVTGSYTFTTSSSDGVRVYVNNVLVINNWTNHNTTTNNGSAITLTAGQKYDIRTEFYENTGSAVAQLQWAYPSQTVLAIPASQFFQSTAYLTGETYLIQGIPANNDHSTGRLIAGADNLLYYSCGDLGANQFSNTCMAIRSQDLPTAGQLAVFNYTNYSGKVLRLNLDGSIPSGNPVLGGVQSHVFTLGHRNPQGLVWQKNPTNGTSYPNLTAGGKLFSTEHGPRTDDEINIIESGKNYGWPYIAGFNDAVNYQYINWSSAPATCGTTAYTENVIPVGATVYQEGTGAGQGINLLSTSPATFQPPLMTNFTICGVAPNCNAGGTNWMQYPTIAPSSVDFYNLNSGTGIPNWYPSLLIPTLRRGRLYRVKMDPTMTTVISDTIPYFATSNRYRDIALSPDGKIYIITDSIGSTSGPSGTGTSVLTNPGAILVYKFTGSILSLRDNPSARIHNNTVVAVYPNPASTTLYIESKRGMHKPLQIEIYDMAGKLMLKGSSSKDNFVISLEAFRSGVYVLKLYNGYHSLITTEKIVVQK